MLVLSGVTAGYGRTHVLHSVGLRVGEGEIVTVIGANGSGKSTLLKAISGMIALSGGTIAFGGERIDTVSVEGVVARGLVQIPEGRQLFGPLTVEENLQLGGYLRRRSKSRPATMKRVFDLFPRLEERRKQQAGTLSGGEQQMLAIGRALMAEPKLLLLDEPSMGLAPILVKDIFSCLKALNEQGLAMLLVEQDAAIALSLAHRGLVMERGNIVLEEKAGALLDNPDVQAIYFGRSMAGRGIRMETP